MKHLKLDISLVESFLQSNEIPSFDKKVIATHQYMLRAKRSEGNLLGWHDYPLQNHRELLCQISELATEVKLNADLVIVIGVGGSFLGARAIQEALTPYFGVHENGIEVLYAGQNMSGPYLKQLLAYADKHEVYVNVISKSGT
ncbi:glucose-6-phosphate isomerase, partial [Sporosarcina newyorkensis 2681]